MKEPEKEIKQNVGDKAESEHPGSAFLFWGRNAVIPGKLDFNFGGINQLKIPSLPRSDCVHVLKKNCVSSIAEPQLNLLTCAR
jgi:hypothetical protein